VEGRVGEERKNVDEVDARNWKVGELTESSLESYLWTGEFGGAILKVSQLSCTTVFGLSVGELPGGSGGGLGELSRGIFTFLLMGNCRKSVGHGGDGREEAGEVGREW
jgi:hypothetical protein